MKTNWRPITAYLNFPFREGEKHSYDDRFLCEANSAGMERYCEAMQREIKGAAEFFSEALISAMLLGGEASLVPPPALYKVIATLKNRGWITEDCEILMHASPERLRMHYLHQALSCCNRICIEALSFQDAQLGALKAPFCHAQIEEALVNLGKATCPHVDMALFLGLPGQQASDFRAAAEIGRRYFNLGEIILRQPTLPPSEAMPEEALCGLYTQVAALLAEYGFLEYAACRFAKPGHESAFSLASLAGCWNLGFGMGAATVFDGFYYSNTFSYSKYIDHSDDFEAIAENIAQLGQDDLAVLSAAAGLRRTEGLAADALPMRAQNLLTGGYAQSIGETVQLTAKGRLHADKLGALMA